MTHDPLDDVYSFVERAYIRLQAGDILNRCLEEENLQPISQMVENLVLAGPQSLGVLREVLAEAGARKIQVMDDLQQVFSGLEAGLNSYGIYIKDTIYARSIALLTSQRLEILLKEQGVTGEDIQLRCQQMLNDSHELAAGLANHIQLLEEIEKYLQDWILGLAYQSTRQSMVVRSL
jgi:hypothetical protein